MNILVLCTGNSCRSQMMHGYLGSLTSTPTKIYSAGIETHGVNPLAIKVLKEDDIDISNHTSNHIDEYRDIHFDFLITVCDHANENCPWFPGDAQKFHHNFNDPSKSKGSSDEIFEKFRETRTEIKAYAVDFVNNQGL